MVDDKMTLFGLNPAAIRGPANTKFEVLWSDCDLASPREFERTAGVEEG
jgi:hypothetical protein